MLENFESFFGGKSVFVNPITLNTDISSSALQRKLDSSGNCAKAV